MLRQILLAAAMFAALTVPAFAYDACGEPPEAPSLPNAATATVADATEIQQSDQDYAQDTEGYLICLQLAESDVGAEAERGERTAADTKTLREKFQAQAADARGKHSGWGDDYDRWTQAWTKAHNQPMPARQN